MIWLLALPYFAVGVILARTVLRDFDPPMTIVLLWPLLLTTIPFVIFGDWLNGLIRKR